MEDLEDKRRIALIQAKEKGCAKVGVGSGSSGSYVGCFAIEVLMEFRGREEIGRWWARVRGESDAILEHQKISRL